MLGVLIGDSQLKFLTPDRLRFAANVQTCTFSVGGATAVFFLDKKQPRRDHFAGDGYHVSHLVGVRALTRLIKVPVVRRLGPQWG
ncbi:unnamed protein product, partial [Ixodes persulcatus]